MAMHRLPAGTEAPRWRLLAAIWGASVILAVAFAFAINMLIGLHIAHVTTPILWLAIQWALWLYLRDRPAQPRLYELEPEPDESPTLRMVAVEADPPVAWPRAGDLGTDPDLARPGRHALREKEPEMSEPKPRPPADGIQTGTMTGRLTPDRFAPFSMKQVEAAALAIWTARTNFNRIRPISGQEAAKQYAALNRYLKEQICREACAALRTHHDKDEFWDRQMERLIDWFNPPDEDAACESIVLDAIERAYKFTKSQPCTCAEDDVTADDPHAACPRCQVLGRVRDVAVPR